MKCTRFGWLVKDAQFEHDMFGLPFKIAKENNLSLEICKLHKPGLFCCNHSLIMTCKCLLLRGMGKLPCFSLFFFFFGNFFFFFFFFLQFY